jgi:ABC-type branched-subunit amino acid transport system substrate-binding protein
VVLIAVLASCEMAAPAAPGPAPSSVAPTSPPAPAAVAFVQDLSAEGSLDRALPVLQAVQLAFAAASLSDEDPLDVEVVSMDTGGEPATASEVAREIAGDPAFVAAIAAPDLSGQAELVARLSVAGVPTISLSGRGSVGSVRPGTWVRLVAPVDAQARVLAETVPTLRRSRSGVCVAAAAPDGTTFARTVVRSLPDDLGIADVRGPAAVDQAGCGVVVWAGDAVQGAELALALRSPVERAPILVGGHALRDPRFLALAAGAAEGAISACSCADVSTSLDLAAQRFIQDYQSEFGSPPGPYAVEAWDAARMVVRGLRAAGAGRDGLTGWLAGQSELDGLGGSYAFSSGELADPESRVRVYRLSGGRWLAIPDGASPR